MPILGWSSPRRPSVFAEFESRHAGNIPVARGDFTPYWENGACSSARETSTEPQRPPSGWCRPKRSAGDDRPRPLSRRQVQRGLAQRDPLRRTHLGRLQQHHRARRTVREGSVEGQAGVRARMPTSSRANSLASVLAVTRRRRLPRRPSMCSTRPPGRGPIWLLLKDHKRGGRRRHGPARRAGPVATPFYRRAGLPGNEVPPLAGRRFSDQGRQGLDERPRDGERDDDRHSALSVTIDPPPGPLPVSTATRSPPSSAI